MNLSHLPDELLLKIAQNVQGPERNSTICSLAVVSRQFQRIAYEALGMELSVLLHHSSALLSWVLEHPMMAKRVTKLRVIDPLPRKTFSSQVQPLSDLEISSIIEQLKKVGIWAEHHEQLETLEADLNIGHRNAYITALIGITPNVTTLELPYRLGLSFITNLSPGMLNVLYASSRELAPSSYMLPAFHQTFRQVHNLEFTFGTNESYETEASAIRLRELAPSLLKLHIPSHCFVGFLTSVEHPVGLPDTLQDLTISLCHRSPECEAVNVLLRSAVLPAKLKAISLKFDCQCGQVRKIPLYARMATFDDLRPIYAGRGIDLKIEIDCKASKHHT